MVLKLFKTKVLVVCKWNICLDCKKRISEEFPHEWENNIFHVLCWILKAKIVQIKWQSDCLNKEKSGEIQWIMKRCVRLAFLLTTCEEDSHQYCHIQFHHHPKGRDMFLWLTFFSQKCPLQNVSIQHIWCLLRKSSHFKRCLCLKGFFWYS